MERYYRQIINKQPDKVLATNCMNTGEIIFNGGHFWCTQAIFRRIRCVDKIENGYVPDGINGPNELFVEKH